MLFLRCTLCMGTIIFGSKSHLGANFGILIARMALRLIGMLDDDYCFPPTISISNCLPLFAPILLSDWATMRIAM